MDLPGARELQKHHCRTEHLLDFKSNKPGTPFLGTGQKQKILGGQPHFRKQANCSFKAPPNFKQKKSTPGKIQIESHLKSNGEHKESTGWQQSMRGKAEHTAGGYGTNIHFRIAREPTYPSITQLMSCRWVTSRWASGVKCRPPWLRRLPGWPIPNSCASLNPTWT